MSDLCAVPECPNQVELYHPERYLGLCREHPDWIMAYGVIPLPDKETPVTTTSVTYPNIACHICGRLDGVHKLDCPA